MRPIAVVDHDAAWPARYEEEAERLRAAWAGDLLRIEHVQIDLGLRFRDLLRADPAAAAAYAALKRQLAERFPADGDLYTALKTGFVHRHTGRPQVVLAEVVLGTARLPELVRFYQRVLGVVAEPAGEDAWVLRPGDLVLRLEAAGSRDAAPGPDRLAFRVHDVEDWCRWLREAGFDVAASGRLRDPDGRTLELV